MPLLISRGEYQPGSNLYESDIVGAIANCIGTNCGKLKPQLVRHDAKGLTVRDDYLARILSLRWSPEATPYDALYKMASDLVYRSNAFAVIFYNDDFTKVKSINPITTTSHRIWDDEKGNTFFKFTWDYDGKEYTVPYQAVIHLKSRYNKKRFLGTPPDAQLKTSLELLDVTAESLRNVVRQSANLKGYLKYNNFIDEDELREKVVNFQKAYMDASNEGGLGGLDSSTDFHEINQKTQTIPTVQSQFLRENIYRYYNCNDKILMSLFNEAEWNAFYESVIEPIAIQLSLECTFKLLSERERGCGNKIVFTADRLQCASLQTRTNIGAQLFDRGIITINEYRELLYYEPIEDGDARMVSLNYVKADEQSIYQIGSDSNSDSGTNQTGGD
jgi:HK97 family phage portal protein